ncbi:MAG TPA: hypothetical protein VJV79_17385 [Polyangiaceae bacterium]|nr:hypothetical protein [Polyangiaceae bacterium]
MPNWNWLCLITLLGCQSGNKSATRSEPVVPRLAPDRAQAGRAPAKSEPGVTSQCSNYATTTQGPFHYQNNMWAQGKAMGAFEQCVVARQVAGKTQLGWTWNWPGYEALGFGYPEIIFGWKPWSARSTTSALPLRISELRALTVRYAVASQFTGKAALSLTIFVTDSSRTSAANPLAIVDELVLWLDYPERAVPVGTRVALFEVAGRGYELWHTPQHGDRGDGTGWELYYLKGPNHQLHGAIQLQPLLEWLLQQKLIRGDRFVASVELGNELMGGSGTTWVEDFDVVVNPAG